MLQAYYRLTKPGIIYGNTLTAAAGFFLASATYIDVGLLAAALSGLALVVASAGVFNNYMDRDIDSLMTRTKKRGLVSGVVSGKNALIYASLLGVGGLLILMTYTNVLTTLMAAVGLFTYVVLYGIAKRRSVYGTMVGSIAGSVPPVVGYLAVTNRFDGATIWLFLILACWQMPHFYAIAIYRLDDYRAAKLPVWPLVKGLAATKKQIVFYIAAFMAAVSMLTVFGYTGYTFLTVMLIVGLAWLWLGGRGFAASNDWLWARQLFRFSLLVIVAFSLTTSLSAWLP